tara:strand:- start:772 stop:1182 length:411 start_codon:yes stop_codon:yes gene_type:complete
MNVINNIKQGVKNKINKYKDKNIVWEQKNKMTLEERKERSQSIMDKYENRIPVICQTSNDLPVLERKKYLVPDDLSLVNFNYVVRKRIKVSAETSIYFFIGNKLLPSSLTMYQIYNKYKDEDGFLYIYIAAENTFG